jgi:hypothetical protein
MNKCRRIVDQFLLRNCVDQFLEEVETLEWLGRWPKKSQPQPQPQPQPQLQPQPQPQPQLQPQPQPRREAERVRDILAETFKGDDRGISITISDRAPFYVTYELRDWDFPKEHDDPEHEWDDDESYDWNMEAQSEAFYDTWEPVYQQEKRRMEFIAAVVLLPVKHTIKSIDYEWDDKNYFTLTVQMNG